VLHRCLGSFRDQPGQQQGDRNHRERQCKAPGNKHAVLRKRNDERRDQRCLHEAVTRVFDQHDSGLAESGQHEVLEHEYGRERGGDDEECCEHRLLHGLGEFRRPHVRAQNEHDRGNHRQADGDEVPVQHHVLGAMPGGGQEAIEAGREVEVREVDQEGQGGDQRRVDADIGLVVTAGRNQPEDDAECRRADRGRAQ